MGTYLRINRNTVIAAYKELEKEGLLVTKHGQGTYISDKLPTPPDRERRQNLINLVEETIKKTQELGFSVEDLFMLVFNQAVLGLGPVDNTEMRALVVECNAQDLEYFQSTLKNELGIQIDAILLSDLPDKINEEAVTKADFAITSIIHLEDVKAILESLNKEVLAIYAAPHLQTYMRIAQLPEGTKVCVACGTERGACNMKDALVEAGIKHIDLEYCSTDIPVLGIAGFLSQGHGHQVIFMNFTQDVDLPEHSHESQWGIILEGKIELVVEGIKKEYIKGDRYLIPKGAKHSGFINKGSAVIEFFNQNDRYALKG